METGAFLKARHFFNSLSDNQLSKKGQIFTVFEGLCAYNASLLRNVLIVVSQSNPHSDVMKYIHSIIFTFQLQQSIDLKLFPFFLFFCGITAQTGARPPHSRGFLITHSSVHASRRKPLNKIGAHHKDTTHTHTYTHTHTHTHTHTYKRRTSRFKLPIPAFKLLQNNALDPKATGISP